MAARAMWKGEIAFDSFRLPVKMYSAVESQSVPFHLLHDQDMVRIKQRMVDPETDEAIPSSSVQRGYEISRGQYVLLEDSDLALLEPDASRNIDVSYFVPAKVVNHQWYDRPYWLGPDGDVEHDYFTLAAMLERNDLEAVVRWTMRKKEYVGALRGEQGYLGLVTLRYVEEIVPASKLDPPTGRELDPIELEMAGKLIDALSGSFDLSEFHDEYHEQIWELIETKRQGGTVKFKEVQSKPTSDSLAESLEASLRALS